MIWPTWQKRSLPGAPGKRTSRLSATTAPMNRIHRMIRETRSKCVRGDGLRQKFRLVLRRRDRMNLGDTQRRLAEIPSHARHQVGEQQTAADGRLADQDR